MVIGERVRKYFRYLKSVGGKERKRLFRWDDVFGLIKA